VGNETIADSRPALVVDNAVATGNASAVTYRFEVSDLGTFPSDPVRTFSADGIPQGSGTTTWTVDRDLAPSIQWFWRARATNGTVTSADSRIETFRTPGGCTFVLSTKDVTAGAGGETGTVAVTAGNSCSWTAVSNVPFITVTSGARGTGNGTVAFTVAPNAGAARAGTVTVANQTVTVNQAASQP
jgi:hypothetical protein